MCKIVGVTKFDGITDAAVLEHCIREELNAAASRYMAVLDPLKVTITNFPDEGVEPLDAVNNPENPEAGNRKINFSKNLYIDRADFMLEPPKGYFRLAPGAEVRLRYGYFIRCTDVVKDAEGNVVEVLCTFDPATRGGNSPDGRKVKGTIHWVSADDAVETEFRLYDRLFTVENPGADGVDFLTQLNPDSKKVVKGFIEPAAASLASGTAIQFERVGYFAVDPDSTEKLPVFNRTVTLKDSWSKQLKK
jgi:glutaminyl-tRNA synthetase